MVTKLYTPTNLMQPGKAEELAAQLNADAATDPMNERWAYKAVHCPKGTGLSFVEVYDEGGYYLGKL